MKTNTAKLWYSKQCKLRNLIFTWDCFLMYLLKIHVDLCQLNQCILDWNLKNNNTKTQYKVVWKQILFPFTHDAYFKKNEMPHMGKKLIRKAKGIYDELRWPQAFYSHIMSMTYIYITACTCIFFNIFLSHMPCQFNLL